jgi:hypothetical protein
LPPEEQQDFCVELLDEEQDFCCVLEEQQLPLFFFFLRLSSSFLTICVPFTAA